MDAAQTELKISLSECVNLIGTARILISFSKIPSQRLFKLYSFTKEAKYYLENNDFLLVKSLDASFYRYSGNDDVNRFPHEARRMNKKRNRKIY